MPEVSVVILNWNRGELTKEAVDSVLGQKGVEVEIIIVDNGSKDGSGKMLAEEFKGRVKMIFNQENLGFSPANNQAFKIASGEWIALLNNDAKADPLWLKHSLYLARRDMRIGIVVPRIIQYQARERLDGIGVGFWLDGLSRAKYRSEIDSPRLDNEAPLVASGCACLLSRKMIEELGGFDPVFFAYSEDTDLGLRAFVSGWRCVFAPKAIVYHRYSQTSASSSGYSPFKLYLVERNRVWILFRYYSFWLVLASPLTSFLRLFFQVFQAFSFKGKGNHLPFFSGVLSLFKAFVRGFLGLPAQLRFRKKWLKNREMKRALFEALFQNVIPLRKIAKLD